MYPYEILTDALQARAKGPHGITFIEGVNDDVELSYADLLLEAQSLLGHFQQAGLGPGSHLVLYLKDNRTFVIAFWACLLGGIVAVPVATGISDEHKTKLMGILDTLDRPWLYTEENAYQYLLKYLKEQQDNSGLEKIEKLSLLAEKLALPRTPGLIQAAKLDDLAFIQFSSGSTRSPKGVTCSHRNLLATSVSIGERYGYTERDISLSWMPLTHDMGLIGFHLTMVVYGMSHCIMSTDLFSRRPLLWMKKVHEKRATALCSPNFGYKHYLKLYETRPDHTLDLSCVRFIVNGAEPISVDLCRQFLDALAPVGLRPDVMAPAYGLAEAGLAVALTAPGELLETVSVDRHAMSLGDRVRLVADDAPDGLHFVTEGAVAPPCEMRIADETRDLGADTVGEIQIRGPNVTAGYYGDEPANESLFTTDGWLKTGDLGFIHNNKMVVTGRLKDIIFVNGLNYYPHDIETTAQEGVGLELGKVVVGGVRRPDQDADEILVFVLHRGCDEDFLSVAGEVKRCINQQAGLDVDHVIPVRRIPKTTSGKVQRRFLVDEYLQGSFAAYLSLCSPAAGATSTGACDCPYQVLLLDISRSVLEDQQLDAATNYFEIGASSLDLSQIHERLEQQYPGVVDITDFFEYPTVAELSGYMRERLA